MTSYCHPLSFDMSAQEVGGKAANLARVAELGWRVPETMVISRNALALFLDHRQLRARIRTYVTSDDRRDTESEFQAIVDVVMSAELPDVLESQIRRTVDAMLQQSPLGLAVRSSATFEDSEGASFAGVFESYVGVLNATDTLDKIRSCWCSLWSPRALRYMDRMKIEPVVDGMAVMVQEVLAARSSGVIYTADPTTGNPWHFTLQATHGLSVDLMSGSGVGDMIRMDWETGSVLESEIAPKSTSLRATSEGVRQITNAPATATQRAVSDDGLREIARIAREMDERFDKRLDIEWVMTSQGLHIVQARPMTAIPAFFPVELTPEQQQQSWRPVMITLPMRCDQPPHLVTPLYGHYSESEMWYRYQPDDIILTGIWKDELNVNGYRYGDSTEQPNFQAYFESPGEYEAWLEKNEPFYRRRWDDHQNELTQIREMSVDGIAGTITAAELIPIMLDVMDRLWDLNSFGWSGPQALGWMCEGALNHFLQSSEIEADTALLLCGGSDSYTFQVTKHLQDLGESIREPRVVEAFQSLPLDEIVPFLTSSDPNSEFLKALETFCWQFGKAPPGWLNRPAFWSGGANDVQIISAIKNAQLGKSRDVASLHADSTAQSQTHAASIRADLVESDRRAAERFDRLLGWARYWSQALNDRHGLTAGLLWERELIWHAGNRLQTEGLVAEPIDLLVLRREDVEVISRSADAREMTQTYRERLVEYRRNQRLSPPPALGRVPAAEEVAQSESTASPDTVGDGQEWSGRGFGGGIATGRARPVFNLLDADVLDSLSADDVLVLPYETAFHYADWHSLLTVIKAVVSPGRPSHHLAQVARECGVPLVGEITGDLLDIADGTMICVDGVQGRVRLINTGG